MQQIAHLIQDFNILDIRLSDDVEQSVLYRACEIFVHKLKTTSNIKEVYGINVDRDVKKNLAYAIVQQYKFPFIL